VPEVPDGLDELPLDEPGLDGELLELDPGLVLEELPGVMPDEPLVPGVLPDGLDDEPDDPYGLLLEPEEDPDP